MILNFENITFDLTEDEKKLLPGLIAGFKAHKGKANAIKGPEICELFTKNTGQKLTEVRLRKLVNYLRCSGTLPVIATSDGYFMAENKAEIMEQVKSLQDRAAAILGAANGLLKFV